MKGNGVKHVKEDWIKDRNEECRNKVVAMNGVKREKNKAVLFSI